MVSLGNTTATSFQWTISGTFNSVMSKYTMPAGGGVITSIGAYFDAWNETPSGARLDVWDADTLELLQTSAVFTPNSKSALPVDFWQTDANPVNLHMVNTSVYVAGGRHLYIGYNYGGIQHLFGGASAAQGGATFVHAQNGGSLVGQPTQTGAGSLGSMGSFINYVGGGGKVFRLGSPAAGSAFVVRNGTFTNGACSVARAGLWTPTS